MGVLALILVAALVACSKPDTTGGASSVSQSGAKAAVAAPGNACDRKLITQADVAALVSESIASVGPIQGDPQSCQFTTTGFSSVSVALRPGLGNATVKAWLSGAMWSPAVLLAGVGDSAAWSATLKEVNASKNNLLCDIDATGPATGPATQQKIAALCDKIFAAY
jgi:hypothetical protein